MKKAPEQIEKDGWVTDNANILSQSKKSRISATLAAYEKDTCHQVFVLIVPSLAGEKLAAFSQRIATAWDIGQPGFGNGILLSIAMQEGSLRLETASAFDWFVDQGVSDRILKEVMVPYFRDERYVEGIDQGLAEIMQAARLKVIPEDHKPEVCRK
ncbi:TPM domain-containing protein [Thermodesulfobacteriota bacterium]